MLITLTYQTNSRQWNKVNIIKITYHQDPYHLLLACTIRQNLSIISIQIVATTIMLRWLLAESYGRFWKPVEFKNVANPYFKNLKHLQNRGHFSLTTGCIYDRSQLETERNIFLGILLSLCLSDDLSLYLSGDISISLSLSLSLFSEKLMDE